MEASAWRRRRRREAKGPSRGARASRALLRMAHSSDATCVPVLRPVDVLLLAEGWLYTPRRRAPLCASGAFGVDWEAGGWACLGDWTVRAWGGSREGVTLRTRAENGSRRLLLGVAGAWLVGGPLGGRVEGGPRSRYWLREFRAWRFSCCYAPLVCDSRQAF